MALPPIVFPAPSWSNQDVVLYHGTLVAFVPSILKRVQLSLGKRYRDFGAGFYLTTVLRQAQTWAAQIAATKSGAVPAVIQFTVSRDALAGLQILAFVRGDFDADDYWSFVHYCRITGAADHGRAGLQKYYDVVYGPVTASWSQRLTFFNADQISFHTPAAEMVLNSSSRILVK